MIEPSIARIFRTLEYAAHRHRDQRRKGPGKPPFINHAIEVAEILCRVPSEIDVPTLQAALLHDTLEDTDTAPEELRAVFGSLVTGIVEEVTDDTHLSKERRRQLQIECAPSLSNRARLVRLADKIANVRAIARTPPTEWTRSRRLEYLLWTRQVVDGCRGVSAELEQLYDEHFEEAMGAIDGEAAGAS